MVRHGLSMRSEEIAGPQTRSADAGGCSQLGGVIGVKDRSIAWRGCADQDGLERLQVLMPPVSLPCSKTIRSCVGELWASPWASGDMQPAVFQSRRT